MPEYVLRVVIEKVDINNEENVIQRKNITTLQVKAPKTILELGLRHSEQIELLQNIQDKLLVEQAVYLKCDIQQCSDCGINLCRNGYSR